MKNAKRARLFAVAAGFALLLAPAAGAEVFKVAKGALEVWACNEDGSNHPRRIDVFQVIDSDFFADSERPFFNFLYSRELGENEQGARRTGAGNGKVKVAVRQLKADGTAKNLGKLGGRVFAEDGSFEAEGGKRLAAQLEEGDVLRWRFTFKGMPKMNEGDLLWLEAAPVRPDF